MTKKRRTSDEWAAVVQEFRASGKSLRAFAAENGLRAETVSWWMWKLGSTSPVVRKQQRPSDTAGVRMLPVTVRLPSAPTQNSTQIEVVMGGAIIRFPVGTAAEYVGALLLEMKGLEC